ncbi:dienelactone hydrolase family protein [Solihabitans fulvus]|uniref:Dienelactone hydrolase family protein n=1 Tax=Solihabitans fulvus TaxID=1892852 RepID=A0A5B2XDU6_9PSEU|nr:dienelactone hydrolase family protein [Solihabitans fulvus]KAA2261275.1 dienelactone hydrolase family protein [Solihabitans fulvus]
MCHSTDSRPPTAPGAGEVAEHGLAELTALDGNTFLAYRATPAAPNGSNVVLLPDVRGVHPFYRELAQRFAEAGFHTVALDYYGRTDDTNDRDDSFDWAGHFAEVTPEQVRLDAAAAAADLRERNAGPVFSVGFCFGGSQSWRLAASDLGLAGSVGFYGQPKLVTDVVDELSAPLLLLLGGADVATPREEFLAFAERLDEAGKEHELHLYEGAPHSFFDRSFGEWADACDDAWLRVREFTARNAVAVSA